MRVEMLEPPLLGLAPDRGQQQTRDPASSSSRIDVELIYLAVRRSQVGKAHGIAVLTHGDQNDRGRDHSAMRRDGPARRPGI
jgi:hypothetical protein